MGRICRDRKRDRSMCVTVFRVARCDQRIHVLRVIGVLVWARRSFFLMRRRASLRSRRFWMCAGIGVGFRTQCMFAVRTFMGSLAERQGRSECCSTSRRMRRVHCGWKCRRFDDVIGRITGARVICGMRRAFGRRWSMCWRGKGWRWRDIPRDSLRALTLPALFRRYLVEG